MAVGEIRRLILSGVLVPGDRLYEERLTERLGISRPPLREALRILAEKGILTQVPRRGFRVTELPTHDIDEIYSLRQALDRFALELAVPRLKPADLEPLAEVMDRMWQAAHAHDAAEIVLINRQFHLLVVGLSRHGRLAQMYEQLMDQMQLCMSANLRLEAETSGDLTEGCRRHERLLDSLRSGDVDQALLALAAHGEKSHLAAPLGREPAPGGVAELAPGDVGNGAL
jgi:DNA-binding GntR family transcriptional regulator